MNDKEKILGMSKIQFYAIAGITAVLVGYGIYSIVKK